MHCVYVMQYIDLDHAIARGDSELLCSDDMLIMCLNGRHYGITVVVSKENVKYLPPPIRSNVTIKEARPEKDA